MELNTERSSGTEVIPTQSSPRAVEVSRELEQFKEVMSKIRFKSPLRCLNDTQKERAVQVLAKRAESQINQLRKIIQESRVGPDLYEIMIKHHDSYKFRLDIPETLLYHYSEPNPVFLYTGETGLVQCDKSKK